MTMPKTHAPTRRNLRGRVVRVVVLSPRPERVALVAGELSSFGHITHTSTSLRDASERELWEGAHVVLMDWAPYEHNTSEDALVWVTKALPRTPVVAIVEPHKPRDGVKALANHAAGLLLSDRLTPRVVKEVVEDAYSRSLAPPPKPSKPRITRECQAIVDKMAQRYPKEAL